MSFIRNWFGVVTRPREPTHAALDVGRINVRVPVQTFPQEAPEPGLQGGAYGLRPARPAQVQVYTSGAGHAQPGAGDFVAVIVGPDPHAAYPRGRQIPQGQRANIRVPPHVAYGSLFTSDQPSYGLQ